MIKNNSTVEIQYVSSNVVQTIDMVSREYYDGINLNLIEYLKIEGKNFKETDYLRKEFVKLNKIKLDFAETVETAPLGLAIMGLSVGESGIMYLPKIQGSQHEIKVLKIYE